VTAPATPATRFFDAFFKKLVIAVVSISVGFVQRCDLSPFEDELLTYSHTPRVPKASYSQCLSSYIYGVEREKN
jgi:hypothetical protein